MATNPMKVKGLTQTVVNLADTKKSNVLKDWSDSTSDAPPTTKWPGQTKPTTDVIPGN